MAATALQAAGNGMQQEFSPMDYFAVQAAVQGIQSFKLSEIGNPKWIKQQTALSQLNIQAHLNIQEQNEQVVVDALYTENKMKHIVHELISIEHWKKSVYPKIAKDMIVTDSVKTYFMLYHEAVLINILEVLFFHKHIVTSIGDDLIDLVDYCMRKMSFLSSYQHSKDDQQDAKNAISLEVNEQEYFANMFSEMEFGIALGSLSVFRYITDVVNEVPLSVMDRILHRNDMICASVDLIEKAPWMKKTKKEGLQVFEDASWRPGDLNMVSKVEGQVWLILYNLLIEPECRKVFQYDERKYEIIQRLRNYFHETLTNQIPLLEALWRHLEELAIVQPQLSTSKIRPVVEEIPDITSKILDDLKNPTRVAQQCIKYIQGVQDKTEYAKNLASIYNLDTLDPLLEDPKCASCGKIASNRCSRCKGEWYCGRSCQVKAWKSHKAICDLISTQK